jgi:hypothetical protein
VTNVMCAIADNVLYLESNITKTYRWTRQKVAFRFEEDWLQCRPTFTPGDLGEMSAFLFGRKQ